MRKLNPPLVPGLLLLLVTIALPAVAADGFVPLPAAGNEEMDTPPLAGGFVPLPAAEAGDLDVPAVAEGFVPLRAAEDEGMAGQPLAAAGTDQIDIPAAGPEDGSGTAAPSLPFAELPVLSSSLAAKTALMSPMELVRVIILLDHQPQDVVSREVQAKHADTMAEIRERVKAINQSALGTRDPEAPTDAMNYADRGLELDAEARAALRAAGEDHEALSAVIRNEIAWRLAAAVDPSQVEAQKAVNALGGTVEFGTVSINALVARVPAGSLDRLAETGGVARIHADRRMTGDLDNAADALRVSDTNSLWDSSYTGGLYDPAVLDSGTDLAHPALEDAAGRTNFWSWYLVAGHADPIWDDDITADDLHGHGTHVMGIVASYGTGSFPNHLGMSFGVEKVVTLKAAWRGTDNQSHLYSSDAMYLLDRALYDTDNLNPADTFSDDVDGLNVSYGGEITTDEDDFCRFFDSVVSSYPDIPVTVSAGNSGPSNTYFRSPASAYNVITVANVDDADTPGRDDDVIYSSSTRGPTNGGRKKPDLAAPGTWIHSCSYTWEASADFAPKSGTSMSAPMVQGIAMGLMDAGVLDELAIKALLINTAQKNEDLIDFESDDDGWSEDYGWGYVNALAATYHRGDVHTASVTARPDAGYFRLYKGQMRDEGAAGEGRDRATLVWNRHATYLPDNYPTSYYGLSDLNLRLYDETDGTVIDTDLGSLDNVHQVRVDAGAMPTDVVVKAYAWSTSFDHGGSTETFALATEEDFVEVPLPDEIMPYGAWPEMVEPNEIFDVSVYVVNHYDVAAHDVSIELTVPSGFTRLSGPAVADLGSIPGSYGQSATIEYTVQAPPYETSGNPQMCVATSHTSYGETVGPYNRFMLIHAVYDTTAPTPDPMTWVDMPAAVSESGIAMSCSEAVDDYHDPVEYLFDFVLSPTGGGGGMNRDWAADTTYANTGLDTNHRYGYRAAARDSAQSQNMTGFTPIVYTYTLAAVPGEPSISNPSESTLDITIAASGNPDWTECAIFLSGNGGATQYYLDASGGPAGGAIYRSIADWGTVTATGLDPDTVYAFRVRARNGDGITTDWSPWGYGTTGSDIDTVSAGLTCLPSAGVVPFQTVMTIELTNEYTGQIRRVAGRINAELASGAVYGNWRAGFTNLGPGETFSTSWAQNIPALGSMIGDNVFSLFAEDVTPAPYNQPPYPASGDTATDVCTVTASAP